MSILRGRRPTPELLRTNVAPSAPPSLFDATVETAFRPGTRGAGEASEANAALDDALARATNWLLGDKSSEGYWWAELESNVTMAAEHVLLEHFLGIADTGAAPSNTSATSSREQKRGWSWPIYAGRARRCQRHDRGIFRAQAGPASTLIEPMKWRAPGCSSARMAAFANARIFTRLWLSLSANRIGRRCRNAAEAILLPAGFRSTSTNSRRGRSDNRRDPRRLGTSGPSWRSPKGAAVAELYLHPRGASQSRGSAMLASG